MNRSESRGVNKMLSRLGRESLEMGFELQPVSRRVLLVEALSCTDLEDFLDGSCEGFLDGRTSKLNDLAELLGRRLVGFVEDDHQLAGLATDLLNQLQLCAGDRRIGSHD